MGEVHGLRIKELVDEKDIPCLRIETDYGMENVRQLEPRIEAFIEQLK